VGKPESASRPRNSLRLHAKKQNKGPSNNPPCCSFFRVLHKPPKLQLVLVWYLTFLYPLLPSSLLQPPKHINRQLSDVFAALQDTWRIGKFASYTVSTTIVCPLSLFVFPIVSSSVTDMAAFAAEAWQQKHRTSARQLVVQARVEESTTSHSTTQTERASSAHNLEPTEKVRSLQTAFLKLDI
jgi:hypothetical protein